MRLRIASVAAFVLLAAPVWAQPDGEDTQVDLESIDALLGGSVVTEPEDDGDAAEEAAIPDGDDDGPAPEEAEDGEGEETDSDGEESEEPEISDLTRAFNAYSLCASEAGAELETQDFAIDQIGQEALLRCGGQRAAYINAFYFDLLPRYPDAAESAVRESAERLVTQSDAALINLVTAEVRDLRNARPDDANEEAPADGEQEETDTDA